MSPKSRCEVVAERLCVAVQDGMLARFEYDWAVSVEAHDSSGVNENEPTSGNAELPYDARKRA